MTRLPECTVCYKPKCPRGRDPGAVRNLVPDETEEQDDE